MVCVKLWGLFLHASLRQLTLIELFYFPFQVPFVELYNCTGRKYNDTCEVRCDAGLTATVLNVQCGSDGKWINLTRGEFL